MEKYRIMCEPLDQLLFFIWISCLNGRHVNCRLGMLYLVEKKRQKNFVFFPSFRFWASDFTGSCHRLSTEGHNFKSVTISSLSKSLGNMKFMVRKWHIYSIENNEV